MAVIATIRKPTAKTTSSPPPSLFSSKAAKPRYALATMTSRSAAIWASRNSATVRSADEPDIFAIRSVIKVVALAIPRAVSSKI